MKIPRASAAAATLLLALICSAGAQEQKFDKYNFAITPPAGWTQATAPAGSEVVAMFVNPGHTATLVIGTADSSTVGTIKGPAEMNDDFVREFNKGVDEGSGGKFISGKFVEVRGIKSYERLGELTRKGKTLSTLHAGRCPQATLSIR